VPLPEDQLSLAIHSDSSVLAFLNIPRVHDPNKLKQETQEPAPEELVAWLEHHPWLDASTPRPASVGGVEGSKSTSPPRGCRRIIPRSVVALASSFSPRNTVARLFGPTLIGSAIYGLWWWSLAVLWWVVALGVITVIAMAGDRAPSMEAPAVAAAPARVR
jgi:hypothetical protein